MKRPSIGLLVSAGAHAVLAAALIAGVSWPRPPAPPSAPSVELVAVATPSPIVAPSQPLPVTPATSLQVATPTPSPSPVPTPAPAALPLPPPAPPQPARKPSPPQRQLALAQPSNPTTHATTANAAPAPTPGATSGTPPADWLRAIAAWLAAHRNYPAPARRAGEQGVVVLRLTLARDGTVRDVSVLQGSGYRDLDAASLAALQGAHLPAASSPDAPSEITLRVPIRYALEPTYER